MRRVLVVSANPRTATALAAAGLEVKALSPRAFPDWLRTDEHVDALVLELGEPGVARAAVQRLREAARRTPVLLVASDRPGWDTAGLSRLPATVVLPAPVTGQALGAALAALLAGPTERATAQAPAAADTDGSREASAAREHALTVAALDELLEDRGDPFGADERLERIIPAPHRPAEERPPMAGVSTAGGAARRTTRTWATTAAARPPSDASPDGSGPAALVRELNLLVPLLYGVAETADVVIAEAVERTGAGAGALIVPDGDRWRVAGGVGLRSLEHRYELDAGSWLVREIALGQQGAVIEDSDVARPPLQGAPLASWRHLLAAPVPDVGAVLLLARADDPAFDEADLRTLALLGREADPLLAAALDTRSLARALSQFREADDG